MLSSIRSNVFPSFKGAGTSTASLEAQLNRYQVQLADWIHCASCNTPEGKAKIKEISDKIAEIQQRIRAADTSSQNNVQAVSNSGKLDAPINGSVVTQLSSTGTAASNENQTYSGSIGVLGSQLDTFA